MSIKKYIAEKDTTITNAYLENLKNRASDANMGASDSLEIFSIYGQATTSSVEQSRILVQFPVQNILNDRISYKIPQSGSVNFFLKLYNVKHPYSLPKDYKIIVSTISGSWDEGYGLDMETYSDIGWISGSTAGPGCTWKYSEKNVTWQNEGGDYYTGSQNNLVYDIKNGDEDIELDVTNIVERWLDGSLANNGFIIRLSGSYEDGSLNTSFYTKKFSSRGSEFFFKRPSIEAKWEAISQDDRDSFYNYSSALSDEDNKMKIYFYNKVNGNLKNIHNNILPSLKIYADKQLTQEISCSYKNVTNPAAGIYKAVLTIDTSASVAYDRWYNSSSLNNYFSSSFNLYSRTNYNYNESEDYVLNISNNKLNYNSQEIVKFKIFARKKDWQPTIYTVAYNNIESETLSDLYYKIFRLNDNYTVIDYSTGSLAYSKTSYDSNGNYFDLDMSILQSGYTYGIKLARWDGVELRENPQIFKFKVG